jgi:hypothetical protein
VARLGEADRLRRPEGDLGAAAGTGSKRGASDARSREPSGDAKRESTGEAASGYMRRSAGFVCELGDELPWLIGELNAAPPGARLDPDFDEAAIVPLRHQRG